ncbi:MAG: hypothetical protein L6277_12805 [Desulfobacterales bacterium]|nr:hypothetical protein [Desulfobacterales bacterium]
MENFYQIAFILISSFGGAGAIILCLSSWLGKVWANRILESDKAKYIRELDEIRQQYNIELNKLSIIHEHQKISFQKIIKAMFNASRALEQPYDDGWSPINGVHYDKLEQIIIEESLFLDRNVEKALNVFLKFYAKATFFPEGPDQSDKMLRNIFEFINYISEHIREYFRNRIGLSEEPNPLLEINLLAAILLINDYNFPEANLPTKTVLKFEYDISPDALVDKIKNNMGILIAELNKLVHYLEYDSSVKTFFFETLTEARSFIKLLENQS